MQADQLSSFAVRCSRGGEFLWSKEVLRSETVREANIFGVNVTAEGPPAEERRARVDTTTLDPRLESGRTRPPSARHDRSESPPQTRSSRRDDTRSLERYLDVLHAHVNLNPNSGIWPEGRLGTGRGPPWGHLE